MGPARLKWLPTFSRSRFFFSRRRNLRHKMLSIPPEVEQLLNNVRRAGFDVWLVGGALRDHLLGWRPNDWDVATNAPPDRVIGMYPRVVPVGLRHGTVQVRIGATAVEVTSYNGRGLEGIVADLGRRDFTINALAFSYPGREIFDPFGGQQDLRAGMLRAVGDAGTRFLEDPLRTLRAGRFVSVYGLSIDRNTFDALKKCAGRLKRVARERIREEMFKLIVGENAFDALEWMRRGDVLQQVFPEFLEGHVENAGGSGRDDLYTHLARSVQLSPRRLRVRLAALFHDIAQPRLRAAVGGLEQYPDHHLESARLASKVLARWRASRKTIQEVVKLVEGHLSTTAHEWTDAQVRRMIHKTGTELMEDLIDLARADRLSAGAGARDLEEIDELRRCVYLELESGSPLQLRDLAVNGDDLMRAFGLRSGPMVGKILGVLHERVLDDPAVNRREILLDLARRVFSMKSSPS